MLTTAQPIKLNYSNLSIAKIQNKSIHFVPKHQNKLHSKKELETKEDIDISKLNRDSRIETIKKHHSAKKPLTETELKMVKDYFFNKTQKQTSIHEKKLTALRNYTMFMLNINIGLRVGDLVKLKISDVVDENYEMRDTKTILEGKTKKEREIAFMPEVKKLLSDFINSLGNWKLDWYLFHSFHINDKTPYNPYKNLSERITSKTIHDVGIALNFKTALASHTTRKTYARNYFDACKGDPNAIVTLQEEMGHSSPKITLAYACITEEEKLINRYRVGAIGF